MTTPDPIEAAEADFAALLPRLSGQPSWLADARAEGLSRFKALGWPTTRLEAWKYTSLRPVERGRFAHLGASPGALDAEALAQVRFEGLECFELVFVDGALREDLSSREAPEGLRACSLTRALAQGDDEALRPLTRIAAATDPGPLARAPLARAPLELNTALFTDGALVVVAPGADVAVPVHLIFVSAGGATGQAGAVHLRNLIKVGRGARLRVIESHVSLSGAPALINAATEIDVADNAELRHLRLQAEGAEATALHNLDARVGRDGRFSSHALLLGGALVRNEAWVTMAGPGGDCALGGLYPLTGRQHADLVTHVDHASPCCQSRQLYKGILHDRARGVFQGKVLVRQPAQKTNAQQRNPNLVLSPGAVANTKPQLEIYADDVRCTHGATVGQLEENADQLFYMRARGLSLEDARQLLIRAFALEVVAEIAEIFKLDPVTDKIEALIAARLVTMTAHAGGIA